MRAMGGGSMPVQGGRSERWGGLPVARVAVPIEVSR